MSSSAQLLIVSDATPLIALAKINCLHLLPQMFHQIIIPEAVFREVTEKTGHPGAIEVKSAKWIETKVVKAA